MMLPASRLSPARVAELWNQLAEAGATWDQTILRFARLIEAEILMGSPAAGINRSGDTPALKPEMGGAKHDAKPGAT